jgi:hypothetical protein
MEKKGERETGIESEREQKLKERERVEAAIKILIFDFYG